MNLAATETINAPRERVFAMFSDIPNAAGRIPHIRKIEMLTDGPVGVGTKWRETREMFGKEHTETLEITEFRAPEFYAVGSNSCGTLYRTTFTFRQINPSTTEVEFGFGGRPQTLIAKVVGAIMAPMMKGMMKKCLASDLAAMKAACQATV